MVESVVIRIAYVSQFSDVVGGGEHSLLDLMRNLPEKYEPLLITPGRGSFSAKADAYEISGIQLPMPKLGIKSFSTVKCWIRFLQKERADVIHANNSRAAFYAGVAGRWLGIPVIFHCRIAERDGLMDGLLMRLISHVICNSQAVARRFEPSNIPVDVVYNGISIPEEVKVATVPWRGERLLLFVGRISREKQLESALRVFAALAAEDAGLHFAVVGDVYDKGYGKELQQICESSDWGQRVHWLGQQEDVDCWYAAADVMILTSKHEGFGRVLVEAMGQGLPVVAYGVGGVTEVVKDGLQGVVVQPDDESAMVLACRKLLNDSALRVSMGQKGRVRAGHFSIQKHVQSIGAIYDALNNRNDSVHR